MTLKTKALRHIVNSLDTTEIEHLYRLQDVARAELNVIEDILSLIDDIYRDLENIVH